MVQSNPALFPIAGDLIMRSMDLPYSDKMADRMKTLLPPAIQEMEASKKPVPPEVQAAMQQAFARHRVESEIFLSPINQEGAVIC